MKDRSILEAILFVAEQPVPTEELAQVMEAPVDNVEAELSLMAEELHEREAGLVLRSVAGGWRMYTRPEVRPYLERYASSPTATRISQAGLETLAVVAYRQPVTRSQVSDIRGVDSERALQTLERLGLVTEIGTAPGPGMPILYGTSELFIEKLGIDGLGDLPPLADHVPSADVVEALERPFRPDTVVDLTGDEPLTEAGP